MVTKKKSPSRPAVQAVARPYASKLSRPEIDALVQEIIGRVADKWTLLVLEALEEHGTLRFSQLAEMVDGISQKMLTKTVRQMESDGFLTRTVYPVIPPRVEYQLTNLGNTLSDAFCGVWVWAEKYHGRIEQARAAFRNRKPARVS